MTEENPPHELNYETPPQPRKSSRLLWWALGIIALGALVALASKRTTMTRFPHTVGPVYRGGIVGPNGQVIPSTPSTPSGP
jgi:hypothetical protein